MILKLGLLNFVESIFLVRVKLIVLVMFCFNGFVVVFISGVYFFFGWFGVLEYSWWKCVRLLIDIL